MAFNETVILLTSEGMGLGLKELQLKLLSKYLHLLAGFDPLPAVMCFYTEGVKLVVEGSPVLNELTTLEAKGVRLVACSTCLDYYGLTDKVKIGIIGSMADILEAQSLATKVITL